jgi:hypothetical protein
MNACEVNPCGPNALCTDLPPPSLDRTCACDSQYWLAGRVNASEGCTPCKTECEEGLSIKTSCTLLNDSICAGLYSAPNLVRHSD